MCACMHEGVNALVDLAPMAVPLDGGREGETDGRQWAGDLTCERNRDDRDGGSRARAGAAPDGMGWDAH